MLKEDPTGFGYFKVREREKLKMSFEILICQLRKAEVTLTARRKSERKAVKYMLRESFTFELNKQSKALNKDRCKYPWPTPVNPVAVPFGGHKEVIK